MIFLYGIILGSVLTGIGWMIIFGQAKKNSNRYMDALDAEARHWHAGYINRKKKIDNQRKRLAQLEESNVALKKNAIEYRKHLVEMAQKENTHGVGY